MSSVTEKKPQWRVMMWFLTSRLGGVNWVQLGFAYLDAPDRDHALARAVQKAASIGFTVDRDTQMRAVPEDESPLLGPEKT